MHSHGVVLIVCRYLIVLKAQYFKNECSYNWGIYLWSQPVETTSSVIQDHLCTCVLQICSLQLLLQNRSASTVRLTSPLQKLGRPIKKICYLYILLWYLWFSWTLKNCENWLFSSSSGMISSEWYHTFNAVCAGIHIAAECSPISIVNSSDYIEVISDKLVI